MKLLFIIFSIAIVISVNAQEFTLQNQYGKMIKKYPFIVPYQPSDSGLVVYRDVVYKIVTEGTRAPRNLCFDSFSLPTDNNSKKPLLVFVHGGGWASGSKEMDHPMAIEMARKGFVCVCIDYRKSGEALYPAAVEDVYAAVGNIKKYYSDLLNLDGRVCVIGSSAGGQLASLVGCNDNYWSVTDDIVCGSVKRGEVSDVRIDRVIDIDGVLAFIHRDSSEGQDRPGKPSAATQWFGKSLAEDKTKGLEASALNHVNANSADYVFIVGTQKRFTAGINEMGDSLRHYHHWAKTYRIFRPEDVDGKSETEIEELPESTTPHCFWLFSPWAEKVVEAMSEALADWL